MGITRDGAFVLASDNPADWAIHDGVLPEVSANGVSVRWPDRAGSRELVAVSEAGEHSLGVIDVVFPLLHGPFGEDGTVQGMLELLGFAYVGSGVLASALAMHKHYTKTVLASAGIPVAPWYTLTENEWKLSPETAVTAADELGYPVFVKPSRAGSSLGVSRVISVDALEPALVAAFAEDDVVLIEREITGREIEVGVLGGRDGAPPRASVAGEIVVADREFYDFDAKYLGAGDVQLICPAPLDPSELERLQVMATAAFEAIGARGLARVDFFWADGPVVNEINTMPGFTPISMFPRCFEASGLRYSELIDELIALGLAASATGRS